MAKGTKIKATFSDGYTITRTTSLNLTHAWRYEGKRHDGSRGGNAGFSGSRTLAEQALASESAYITKPSKWNNNKTGQLTFAEVAEVEKAA